MQWNRRTFLKAGGALGVSALIPPTLLRAETPL